MQQTAKAKDLKEAKLSASAKKPATVPVKKQEEKPAQKNGSKTPSNEDTKTGSAKESNKNSSGETQKDRPFTATASLPKQQAISRLPYSRAAGTAPAKPLGLSEIAATLHTGAKPVAQSAKQDVPAKKSADTSSGRKPQEIGGGDLAKARSAYAAGEYMHASEVAKPLALAGDSGAQELLADLYLSGLAGIQDSQEAARLYRKAAAASPSAQYKLGMLYYKGDALERDYSEAVRWFRKAAISAYGPAQDKLIDMYESATRNIPANPWLKDAALSGDMRAMSLLAHAYHTGSSGVKRDTVEALRWYLAAAKGGGKSAATARASADELMRSMTTGQIEKARAATGH